MAGNEDTGTDQDTGNNDDDTGTDDDGGDDSKGEKSFTQAEVDAILAKRLKRVDTGLSKAEIQELRDKAKKHDETVLASKTAEEQAQEKAKEAEQRATAATANVRKKSLRAAIAEACSASSITDVDVVRALITTSDEPIEYDDDDEPIGIADRVKAIVKARPALKGSKFDTGGDGGGKPPAINYSDNAYLETLPMDQWMAARAEGKIPK